MLLKWNRLKGSQDPNSQDRKHDYRLQSDCQIRQENLVEIYKSLSHSCEVRFMKRPSVAA